jgi:hypothetical protein
MMPGPVGVTVKPPATGALIEAAPVEPLTTVCFTVKVELAVGLTVEEPALIARLARTAKLTNCHVGLTGPAVKNWIGPNPRSPGTKVRAEKCSLSSRRPSVDRSGDVAFRRW